jgi:hypothetical protein
MTVYPVGAAWTATGNHKVGRVWLARRDGNLEVWNYSSNYTDGSGYDFDWAPSRRKAIELCKDTIGSKVRFKREKEES